MTNRSLRNYITSEWLNEESASAPVHHLGVDSLSLKDQQAAAAATTNSGLVTPPQERA